ncbi:hypothetical protein BpHYR1_017796 [Brachionus plicatilis]|uniref:Uncharacterized protein n=1 Tax=Brachionus plicatilis TaxID=10195 RepID=A0A3M7P5C1_BRAPC|nr:hypothetical protein BpHYR1_017796 [Brachionus plicatilis]
MYIFDLESRRFFFKCALNKVLHYRFSEKKIEKINPSSGDIKNDEVAHGFACDSNDRCLRIKEFFIPANFRNNCYEKNLPIQFGNNPQT